MWSSWFLLRPFHAYPHRFTGFNNTSVFCLVLSTCATGFPVLMKLNSTRHCCWHWNFQLSTSFFFSLEFFIIKFNKEIPRNLLALPSCGFSMAPFLLFSSLRCIRHLVLHIGHTLSGLDVVCFLVSLHPGPCIIYPVASHSIQ